MRASRVQGRLCQCRQQLVRRVLVLGAGRQVAVSENGKYRNSSSKYCTIRQEESIVDGSRVLLVPLTGQAGTGQRKAGIGIRSDRIGQAVLYSLYYTTYTVVLSKCSAVQCSCRCARCCLEAAAGSRDDRHETRRDERLTADWFANP